MAQAIRRANVDVIFSPVGIYVRSCSHAHSPDCDPARCDFGNGSGDGFSQPSGKVFLWREEANGGAAGEASGNGFRVFTPSSAGETRHSAGAVTRGRRGARRDFSPSGIFFCSEVESRWGIPQQAKCLIYVGGFTPHKNLLMLLDVFGELVKGGKFPDMRLVCVGDYATDPFHSSYGELAERVRQAHLEEEVIFTGRLSDEDLVILMNRSDALVLPSFSEGFGLPRSRKLRLAVYRS